MSRTLAACAAAMLAVAIAGCGGGSSAPGAAPDSGSKLSGKVTLATYGGAYTKATQHEFLEPFGRETGVQTQTVDAPGEMVAKLQAQSKANRVTWDLVEPDEYEILALAKRGLVRKLPADVKADLIKAVGSEHVTDYGILSAAYADVLVCNRDAVKRCPKNAAEFWDVKGFPGRRTMYGDGWLESAVAAVQADGVPRDQVFPPDMDRAYRKLDEIKPDVAVWWKTGDQSQQIFRDEEVAMGYMWDGRAYGLLDQGVNVEISHDGSPLHRTLFVVTKDAPNPEAAYAFLRWFATHPRNQAEWVKKMHYGLPHPDVFKYLPEDVAEQIATFPANADVSVRVDPQWAASNQARELKRWADWIGR